MISAGYILVPYHPEHDKPAVALDLSEPAPCKGAAASGQTAAEQPAPGGLVEVDPLAGQPGTVHDAGEGCVHDYAAPNPATPFSASSRVDVGFLAAPYPPTSRTLRALHDAGVFESK